MFDGELRTVTNLRQFPDMRKTLFMLEWEALVGDALPVTKKIDGGKATYMKEYLGRHGTLSTQEKPKHKGVEIRMRRTPGGVP